MSPFHMMVVFIIFLLLTARCLFWDGSYNTRENCLCAQEEECCLTTYVDKFNKNKFFPVIQSLILMPYFRFYKVNTECGCPFWDQNYICPIRNCAVDRCTDQELPEALKKEANNVEEAICAQGPHVGLDSLDKTLSLDKIQFLKSLGNKEWEENQFCDLGDNEPTAEFVDLPLNPERFTGYSGRASNIIWELLYEGCKECDKEVGGEIYLLNKIISGMHASVNIHLCSIYPLGEHPDVIWDFNYECFIQKFLSKNKIDKSKQWFQNLYFLYSIINRAILKAENIWDDMLFTLDSEEEDVVTKNVVMNLTNLLKHTSFLFNEESKQLQEIENKREFIRTKFLNASKLMDCVGCEKCKVWGKLQTQGIGTALKILLNKESILLSRNEIVSLFNAAARYSTSIGYLDKWRDFVDHIASNEHTDEL